VTLHIRTFREQRATNSTPVADVAGQNSSAEAITLTVAELARLADRVVFRLTTGGECVQASANVEGLLGLSPEALVGRSLAEFQWRDHPDQSAESGGCISRFLEQLVRSGYAASDELEFADAAGQHRIVRASGCVTTCPSESEPTWLVTAKAVPASGSAADESDASRADLEECLQAVGRSVHAMSNTLTAIVCEWDLAFSGDARGSEPQTVAKLTALIGQAAEELKALARLCADSRVADARSEQNRNHAGPTDSNCRR
jgi:PAS domain-containing protein